MGTQGPDILSPLWSPGTHMDVDEPRPSPALAALRQPRGTVPLAVYRALGVSAPEVLAARSARSGDETLYPLGALHRCFARPAPAPEDAAGTGAGRRIMRDLGAAFDQNAGAAAPAAAADGGNAATLPAAASDAALEEEVAFEPPAYEDGNPLTAVTSNEPLRHRECVLRAPVLSSALRLTHATALKLWQPS